MNSDFWIILGIVASCIGLFALPYGFHLKSKEEQANKMKEESLAVNGDVVAVSQLAGSKVFIAGDVNFAKDTKDKNDDQILKIKVAKLKIKREFEDFDHAAVEALDLFKKDAGALAGKFNARGMLTSGDFIKAQMELSQTTKDKVDRLWVQMNRNIEDVLVDSFGQTSFDEMINEFLDEHNKKAELANTKKEIYLFLEVTSKNWEKKIFNEERLTKDFKLQ